MYEYAKMKFLKFISNNYDLNDEKIKHKLKHTFHVVTNAKYLCDEMNIDSNNKEIALLIALLHDMGRFDQAKVLKNFREDINNYDHATLGVKLLFENNLIREFVKEDQYDDIIKIAIFNHSKYIVDFSNDFMNEKTILSKDRKTPIDIWISYIAFIYGLYFKESLIYLKQNDYVNKLVDKFDYKLEDTKEKMEQIRNKGNDYIFRRIFDISLYNKKTN